MHVSVNVHIQYMHIYLVYMLSLWDLNVQTITYVLLCMSVCLSVLAHECIQCYGVFRACVCVCVSIYMTTFICVYSYMRVLVCVCVCQRGNKLWVLLGQAGTDGALSTQTLFICMCVCGGRCGWCVCVVVCV